MGWMPVMTLPDASAIEVVLPSADTVDTDAPVCGFRVRHPDGRTTELETLAEVAIFLRERFAPEAYDSLVSDPAGGRLKA